MDNIAELILTDFILDKTLVPLIILSTVVIVIIIITVIMVRNELKR